MKKKTIVLTLGTLLVASTFLISCKKERKVEATVITDCTGIYLRMNNKDYKVCNLDKIQDYESGQKVEVTFKKMKDCADSGKMMITCSLNHPYESWAEILDLETL